MATYICDYCNREIQGDPFEVGWDGRKVLKFHPPASVPDKDSRGCSYLYFRSHKELPHMPTGICSKTDYQVLGEEAISIQLLQILVEKYPKIAISRTA